MQKCLEFVGPNLQMLSSVFYRKVARFGAFLIPIGGIMSNEGESLLPLSNDYLILGKFVRHTGLST